MHIHISGYLYPTVKRGSIVMVSGCFAPPSQQLAVTDGYELCFQAINNEGESPTISSYIKLEFTWAIHQGSGSNTPVIPTLNDF